MRKTTLAGIALLLILPLMALVGAAGAQSFQSGNNVTVSRNQTVDGALWTSGRNLDIAGTVNGDIFCASQNVTISGTVNGDVLCAAQTIRISGNVSGDVRLAAQTVTLSSQVAGSASIASQSISLEQTARVGRDASMAANDITLNGAVGRDAALTGSTVVLASSVGRNVKATVERLTLEAQARVGGDVTYTSKNQATVAPGAVVSGTTHRFEPQERERPGFLSRFGILLNLYTVVSLLLVALAFVLLLPRLFHEATSIARREPLKTLLVGLVATLVFPVLFVALLFTLLGIPLALLLLMLWLLAIAFGVMLFSYYIGRLVLRNQRNPIIIMLVGALIYLVATLIPFLDIVVVLAAIWMGTGMVLLDARRRYRRPVYDLPPQPMEVRPRKS